MTRRSSSRVAALGAFVASSVSGGVAEEASPAFTAPFAPVAERFASPPAAARILKIIHGWPDEPAQQDQLRATLRRQGFGGVVCNISFQDYLESEARWKAFERAVHEAKREGMALWLYDEKGYPSGNAGGLVLRDHPEWAAEGLLVADAECGSGPLTIEVPPGKPILAAAFSMTGSERIELPLPEGERLNWTAPPGHWQVVVITHGALYAGTHAEMNLAEKTPYINLLRPEPTRRFLEVTHRRYAEHLGTDLGRWFEATFTDEPSLMSMFFRRMPYRPLPWAPDLPNQFRQRRGYDLPSILPDLVRRQAGPEAARHRHDFWLTVGELVSENFFGQIQDECRRLGVPSGGHLLAEEGIVNHVPLYGDFFRCLRRMDAPSIDCLTSVPEDVPWYIARLAASAAELDGRRLVMCETSDHSQVWRPAGDTRPKRTVTEAEIRGTCNRLLVAGVNVITSYYSFAGLDDAALRRLNEWVGRCTTLLAEGRQVADVAVVYPVESLWTRFVPAAHWAAASPEANRIGALFRTVGDALFEARRDFTVVDSRTLAEARVEGDALVHGALRWRVVVLPGVDTLPRGAWVNLEQFGRAGGAVIAVGAKPANSGTAFPDPEVVGLGRRLFGEESDTGTQAIGQGTATYLPAGTESLLPELLSRMLPPEATLAPEAPRVRITHRRSAARDLYFLVQDSAQPWEGQLTLPAGGTVRLWDPASGESRSMPAGQGTPIRLDGYGAVFVTTDRELMPSRKPLEPGPIPGLQLEPVKVGAATESHGEFVRAEWVEVGGGPATGRPARGVRGSLLREKVDTFLFVRLPVTSPDTLRDAGLIEVETWVPEGQRAPAQLLVILHEEGGGDFLAETPRALGVPGWERTLIPINQFKLAGWSNDADGVLDRSRISEIRIGWGGYYGYEGETVEFGFAVPRMSRAHGLAGLNH